VTMAFHPELRGELRLNEPMARHTSWRVGGPADLLFIPADEDDLALFLRHHGRDQVITWVGLGSNLLVRDGGIRGCVIAPSSGMAKIEWVGEGLLRAAASAAGPQVARFTARAGMAGLTFLAGIPGTIGGALAMNAGCHGCETWQRVESVDTIDIFGNRRSRQPGDYLVSYRLVNGPMNEWFTSAIFRLTPGDSQQLQAEIKERLAWRSERQPTREANAGSVFRNPEGDHAARLIDAAGLKGFCIGGACVSEKHANFIVNRNHATATEIEILVDEIALRVLEQTGVELEREIQIVGEAG
jgi:UDP-N-acetylmuramate dehydrogenase